MPTMKGKYGTGTIYKRTSGIWWIQFYANGVPFRESSGSRKKSDAEALLKVRNAAIVTGKFGGAGPERITVPQLIQLVFEDYEHAERKSTYDIKARARKHIEPFFREIKAAKLSSRQIDNYIHARQSKGAANGTINRELAILRRALSLGAQQDPPLVLREIFIRQLKEAEPRQGFLEHDDYLKLRSELPPALQPLYVVAYHVGCRAGELTAIQWSQVDQNAETITLQGSQTKNGQPRVLPIYGEMRHWLEMAKSEQDLNRPGYRWVFTLGRSKWSGARRDIWDAACERAGLPGLLFHDLRRSAVRNMERAGIPRTTAMQISGHKTESVYRRYAIVSEKDIREAGRKMADFLARGTERSTLVETGVPHKGVIN